MEINLTEHHPGGCNPHFAEVFETFWESGYAARTADRDGRSVAREDVLRWVARRERDFGSHNYIFEKTS
jgi:hypothetical protein